MNKRITTIIAITIAAPAFAGGWFSDDSLGRAHHAYLKGDFKTMTAEVRETLKGNDPTASKNAIELVEKAYETSGGNLPCDWKLPPGVKAMRIALKHHHRPERDDFALKISGAAPHGLIKNLRLTRYPDTVMLDKATSLGEWAEEDDLEDGPEYSLDGPRGNEPAAEGLYLVDIELASGSVTHGWFILSGMLSSETPSVAVPSVGQSFSTVNPTLRWQNFRSPEYRPFERRGLWLGVAQMDPPSFQWKLAWSKWLADPELTEITVGPKALDKGRYFFYVAYSEKRGFGDLRLGRESVTVTPFTVR